jgi:hypothetical protein
MATSKETREILLLRRRPPNRVRPLDQAARIERPRPIHQRRLLPRVKEGTERNLHSATPRLSLGRSTPMSAGEDVVLLRNTPLADPGSKSSASSVGEPSTAMNGAVVFYTGNWYAAFSTDSGQTFRFINPDTVFKDSDPPGKSFCCDQVVQYINSIDTFVWLLQYGPSSGDNIQRLAFAKSADVERGNWRLFDITTDMLAGPDLPDPAGCFMDFPDLAVGANSLYVTTNLFYTNGEVGSAVFRIPLTSISDDAVTARPFVSTDLQSFRVAQSCGTTGFFAAHQDTSTLVVYSWSEGENVPTPTSIPVARWIGGNSGYDSRTLDGRRWLDRADPRLSGATLAGNELWFAWSVDKNSNHRPKPFIQIARISAVTMALIENVNVFDANSATAYGALATNADGEVGISYIMGGDPRNPTHVVGILTNARKDVIVSAGDRSPLDPVSGNGEWGDYLSVRPAFPSDKLFAASGYTMLGAEDGTNRDVTARFVIFGRASNTGSAPTTGGGAPPIVVTSGNDEPEANTKPFTDIDTLPTVSPAAAKKILAAAVASGLDTMDMSESMELKFVNPELMTKPGVERWPVKTGQDPDVGRVGKNIIKGVSLGLGIVPVTIEELIRIKRQANMRPATRIFSAFQSKRQDPVEFTVWQIEADITVVKLEADGDYHLVVQGTSGDTMIAEVPTGTKKFIGTSPWLANIKAARAEVDEKFMKHFNPQDFVQMDNILVPRDSVSGVPQAMPESVRQALPRSFATPLEGDEVALPVFQAKVKATPAKITGVGFFDADHGQTGVAHLNGIELHPVLKIEWL